MTSRLVEWIVVVVVFVFLLLARNSSCGGRTRVGAVVDAVVDAVVVVVAVVDAVVDAAVVNAADAVVVADGAATVDAGGCRPHK